MFFPTVLEEAADVTETFPTPFAHYRGRGNRKAVQLYWVDGVLIARHLQALVAQHVVV